VRVKHGEDMKGTVSAHVEGKTVEVSLSQKKVMQSRGLCNKNSPYHDRIIEQVNRHIREWMPYHVKIDGTAA
jgi:fibrillarin-like rRNA methylase